MIAGGTGGGNTTTGIIFEDKVDILTFLKGARGYSVEENHIFYHGRFVASSYKKYELYRFIKTKGVNWKDHISKRLLPDDAIYVIRNNTLFIIEIKFQKVAGSVDEKLQTCNFKRRQYLKLFAPLNLEVEYIYILNDWYRKPEYKDTLDYIHSVNCQYYFNYLPLEKIGLPVPR